MGRTITSSTSKITKITAKIKNRSEIKARTSDKLLNPHSSGVIASRFTTYILDNKPPSPKNTKERVSARINKENHRKIYLSL